MNHSPYYLQDLPSFLDYAFREDIGDGDHTSLSTLSASAKGSAKLIVKGDGVLAGIEMARHIFSFVDKDLEMKINLEDGAAMKKGDIAFTVKGAAQSILTAERLVLNCMQRMSGIATLTKQYTHKLDGLKTRVLDTRKTTPGFRIPEKWAVLIGGGQNHRFGLYDMILIKDNHIDFCGGIEKAILKARDYNMLTHKNLQIEVETRNLEDVKKVLDTGIVSRIMLDNFSTENLRQAVKLIDGAVETEASGGITLDTIRSYAETGVDYISVGALTHSAQSIDLSLKAEIS